MFEQPYVSSGKFDGVEEQKDFTPIRADESGRVVSEEEDREIRKLGKEDPGLWREKR